MTSFIGNWICGPFLPYLLVQSCYDFDGLWLGIVLLICHLLMVICFSQLLSVQPSHLLLKVYILLEKIFLGNYFSSFYLFCLFLQCIVPIFFLSFILFGSMLNCHYAYCSLNFCLMPWIFWKRLLGLPFCCSCLLHYLC